MGWMRQGGKVRSDCGELLYTRSAFLPAAPEMAFQPPLPVLSEARVVPLAAADKLTLDSGQIGKKRFPRSAHDLLALAALRWRFSLVRRRKVRTWSWASRLCVL